MADGDAESAPIPLPPPTQDFVAAFLERYSLLQEERAPEGEPFDVTIRRRVVHLAQLVSIGITDAGLEEAGREEQLSGFSVVVARILDIAGNRLSLAQIVRIAKVLSRLQEANIARNPLADARDVGGDRVAHLRRLIAAECGLTTWDGVERMCKALADEESLQDLTISSNALGPAAPPRVPLPRSLRILRMDSVGLEGRWDGLLEALSAACPGLQELSLADNAISPSDADEVEVGREDAWLTELEVLNMARTSVSSFAAVRRIGRLRKLHDVRLREVPLARALQARGEDSDGVRLLLLGNLDNLAALSGAGLQSVGSITAAKFDGSMVTRRDRLDARAYWERWSEGQVAPKPLDGDDPSTSEAVEATAIFRSLHARFC